MLRLRVIDRQVNPVVASLDPVIVRESLLFLVQNVIMAIVLLQWLRAPVVAAHLEADFDAIYLRKCAIIGSVSFLAGCSATILYWRNQKQSRYLLLGKLFLYAVQNGL